MTRWFLSAAALGTLTGLALTFGPHAALGVAVCALAVIVWFGVKAAREDRRVYRERVWQRRIDEARSARPELSIIKGGKEPDWLADLKPWPIGDDEVRP